MNIIDKVLNYKKQYNIGLCKMTNEFFAWYVTRVLKNDTGVVIVTPSLYEANKIYNSLIQYEANSLLFQVDDVRVTIEDAVSPELKLERLNTINELLKNPKQIVITDLAGFVSFLPNPKKQLDSYINLSVDMDFPMDKLVEDLVNLGYHRDTLVTETGEIGVRGFVLDVYPVGEDNPIRIEFFGDSIVSIRYFDSDSQKSLQSITSVCIKPNGFFNDGDVCNILSYMNDPVVIYKDYDQLQISYERLVNDAFYDGEKTLPFFDFKSFNTKKNLYYLDFDSKVSSENR